MRCYFCREGISFDKIGVCVVGVLCRGRRKYKGFIVVKSWKGNGGLG